jgi:hypothetical protein
VLDGNCVVWCGSGKDCFVRLLCCGVWIWNGLSWRVTVLQLLGLEKIVLDGNCAVGCRSGPDCVSW